MALLAGLLLAAVGYTPFFIAGMFAQSGNVGLSIGACAAGVAINIGVGKALE